MSNPADAILTMPLADDMHGGMADEGTLYSGNVRVTDTAVITMTDVFPRFVAMPTISSVRSGFWSDPNTWSLGRVPTDGDRVRIASGNQIIYQTQSDAHIDGLEIGGSLSFNPTYNTRLIVGNMMVMPNGKLQIGSASVPVSANVKAELIIADRPLDLQMDPSQYGTGLVAFGAVTMFGAPVDVTWTTLGTEPKAGDNSLVLADSSSQWHPGDTLVLPDTRQVSDAQYEAFKQNQLPAQWEEVTVASVSGNRVYLTKPLQFNHLGARNTSGQLELLPHVALLTRNVIVRSENPQGTRGHTLFAARADVDIEFVRFQDLGRTDAFRDIDNTKYDEQGNVTHIGTNQIARYAVHFHHLMGPENSTNTGYQYEFVGNSVENSTKWAVAIHGTNYGLVSRNVVYGAQGAGIVTEDGSEIGNVIARNISIRMVGTHIDGKSGTEAGDYGRGGVGFWFRRGGNTIVGNVAADSTYAGFVFDGYYTDEIVLPAFRGAMKHAPGQGVHTQISPATVFVYNEAYGLSELGLWATYISGDNELQAQPTTTITNLRIWNTANAGVVAYHTRNVVFDRLLILGDLSAQTRNDTGPRGMDLGTYENYFLVIRNSRIEGVRYGIRAPTNDASTAGVERPTIIQNSTLKNYINLIVTPSLDERPRGGNVLELRNVKFELVKQLPYKPIDPALVPASVNIWMKTTGLTEADWSQPSIVRIYDYNQQPGNNFQVYYREQVGSFVMPRTKPEVVGVRGAATIGSPEKTLTNLENWAKYGISFAGSWAPLSAAQSNPDIIGLIGPIRDQSQATPRVVLVTPWNGLTIDSDYLAVHYTFQGLLPAGARLFFQLDDRTVVNEIQDGGFFNLTPGQHVLRAYIGDLAGNELSGTIGARVTFHTT